MASKTRKWKKGLGSTVLKKKDEKKGQFYRAPGDRVFYYNKSMIKAFIPKEGKNRVRIVQPFELDELEFYGLEMHFHRSVGDEGEDLFGDYICNRIMKEFLRNMYEDIVVPNKCFVCEQQTPELWDDMPQLAKTYYPDRRMWFLILDLLADDCAEVLLWSCPWTLHEEILSRSSDEETGAYIDVSDPVEGVPVSFERTGKGKLTKYTNVQIFKTPDELGDTILGQVIEFRDILIIPEYDQVKLAMLAGGEEVARQEPDESGGGEQQEDEQVSDGPPDCYNKEYDKWQDCETCEYAAPCSEPPEKEKKPEKPVKPVKPQRPPKRENADATDKATSDETKDGIREKIKKAQEKRKGNN